MKGRWGLHRHVAHLERCADKLCFSDFYNGMSEEHVFA